VSRARISDPSAADIDEAMSGDLRRCATIHA
jgi:aerobic-type carbon monoxide dehydrogenase small subunit (CoxS/CutS family)